jgi:hypothetical protein
VRALLPARDRQLCVVVCCVAHGWFIVMYCAMAAPCCMLVKVLYCCCGNMQLVSACAAWVLPVVHCPIGLLGAALPQQRRLVAGSPGCPLDNTSSSIHQASKATQSPTTMQHMQLPSAHTAGSCRVPVGGQPFSR